MGQEEGDVLCHSGMGSDCSVQTLRNKDEFHGYTLCVHKAVAGKQVSV